MIRAMILLFMPATAEACDYAMDFPTYAVILGV